MSGAHDRTSTVGTLRRVQTLDVVIPVHDEARTLVASVEAVRRHLATLPFGYRVTIADNASTDGTTALAAELAERHADVRLVALPEKGRGRALKAAWSGSDADVLVYMDVDLSTDLNALLPLVAPLLSGSSTQSTGTSWMRSPARSATTSSSVSKNHASSSTSGSSCSATSRRSALNPHCASLNRACSVPRSR